MSTKTKNPLESIDFPTFFWLGEEGVEALSPKDFTLRIKKAEKDKAYAEGDFDEERLPGI